MVDAVRTLLVKKELVYATDAAPTGAANAVLVRNFRTSPIETDRLDRDLDIGTWGAQPGANTNARQRLSFEVEASGSGAAGTAPRWMEILEGCGMAAPVLVAGTSATQRFALSSAAPSSLTIHHQIADQRRRTVGARGNWSLDITATQYPFFALETIGLLATTPFDTNAPAAPDYTAWKAPVEVNMANTSILIDAFAAPLKSLRINAGLSPTIRNLVGARYVNRGKHAASFEAVIEMPALADKNYLQALTGNSLFPIAATHGTAAGHILEVQAPRAQIAAIAESEEDGKSMWTISGAITVSAPGDELSLIAK